MPARLGYLDAGPGKTKVPDPGRAPLMKMAFELYATRQYSLKRLADKLFELGLRTKAGKQVTDSVLSRLLSNPFYMGVIRIRKTGDSYLGVHPPLISKDLFDCVQHILRGKYVSGPHAINSCFAGSSHAAAVITRWYRNDKKVMCITAAKYRHAPTKQSAKKS